MPLGQTMEVPLTVIAEEVTSPKVQRKAPVPVPDPTTPTTEEISFVVHLDTKMERVTKSSPEQDSVVQKHVQFLLDDTQPPVKPRKLQSHIDHVIMIRLGHLLHEGHLDFQSYSAEKDKLRAEMISDFATYDTSADIYARLDQDLMAKKPKKKGEPEPDKDSIIQMLVGNLLKEAKVATDSKDLRHHEEHILSIRLGSYLKAGKLTFVKYTELKNNEIEYYSFDTDIFGRLDKLILVEVEVIIARERVEEEKLKAEREARWAAEKAQQEQDKKEAVERARQRREEKLAREAEEARKAKELAEKIAEEEAAARLARAEQRAAEEAQREAEEAVRLELERREKEVKAAAWRMEREEEEERARKEREKVKDYFPEQRSLKKKDEEKIVIKPNLRAAAKFGGSPSDSVDKPAEKQASIDKPADESVTMTAQFVETTQIVETTPIVVETTKVVEATPIIVETAQIVKTTPIVVETTQIVETTPIVVETTQTVETTPIVVETKQEKKQKVAVGKDAKGQVKWEVLVSGDQDEVEAIQSAIQGVELAKADEGWTIKVRQSGSDDYEDIMTTSASHNTSLVTNVTSTKEVPEAQRHISVWSTTTPASPPTRPKTKKDQ